MKIYKNLDVPVSVQKECRQDCLLYHYRQTDSIPSLSAKFRDLILHFFGTFKYAGWESYIEKYPIEWAWIKYYCKPCHSVETNSTLAKDWLKFNNI